MLIRKQSINHSSLRESRTKIPGTNIYFCQSENYFNIKGEHPKIGTAIHYKDIVFSKEKLTEDKWMIDLGNLCVEDVKKDLENKNKSSIWIIIRSEDDYKKEEEKEKIKWEQMRQKQSENMERFVLKHTIDQLNNEYSTCIKSKYMDLTSFENEYLKPQKMEVSTTLINNYRNGDEIWVFNNYEKPFIGFIDCLECILLIRDNKIICSPLNKYRTSCVSEIARRLLG